MATAGLADIHNNRFNGDFFGGIYATHLADFLGVSIRNDDIELPPAYLDFTAMVLESAITTRLGGRLICTCGIINGKMYS